MTTAEYPCADGTMLPVRFAAAGDEEAGWRLELEHLRNPLPPMADAMERLTETGSRRAYEEVGMTLPPFWARRPPEACGFFYFCAEDPTPDEMQKFGADVAMLVGKYGDAEEIWEKHSLPLVKEMCQKLRDADHTVPLAALAELQGYSLHKTMIPAYPLGADIRAMAALIEEVFPGEERLRASEVTQGYENVTTGVDQQLWEIARRVGASPTLTAALVSEDVGAAMEAARAAGEDREFFAALDAFLDLYGEQTEVWDIGCPTWGERGPGFWSQLRMLAAEDAPEPRRTLAEAAARRETAVAEVEARLTEPEKLESFRRKLARLRCYVPVREDRALWQVITVGALRGAVLRRGAHLVSLGLLDDAADILFLVPDEVEAPAEGADLRALVKERRAEHERWQSVEPPLRIGAAPEEDRKAPAEGVIEGRPGSRGTVTATARIVLDLSDADRLGDGEVLVCPSTAPPWTPLFNLAAAVVTDSGDVGSHSAIAAREYGIPCVVGTGKATRTIPDGATVTVDGAAGTVTILGGGGA